MNFVELGKVVEIKGGGTPDKSNPNYWGGSIPWASVKDFKSTIIENTIDMITEDGVKNSATNIIPAGSIIVPTRMAVGKAAINKVDMAINQDLKALFPSPEIDTRFLFHCLLANSQVLERQASGATVKGIKLDVLRALQVPVISMKEQKRIAAILDQADALRQSRRHAITRLNDLSQSIFYEMFDDPIQHLKNPENPKLSDIAELINGDRSKNYPSGDDIIDEGVLFLSTKNIVKGKLSLNETSFISEKKFSSLSRGKLKKNDLIITLRGTLGQCCIFNSIYDTGFINAQMMIIRPSIQILPQFLHAYLMHSSTQSHMTGSKSGSAVSQLTAKQIGEMRVFVPTRKKQEEFLKKLEKSHRVLDEHKKQLHRTETLFLSLQQRAFRGEL